MKKRLAALSIVMILLCIVPAFSQAAEDLFDTGAAAALVEQGVKDLKSGRYDAAIDALEESVGINPDAQAFYYLGYAYYMKSKKENGESRAKSRESFDKAYALDPNFTPGKMKLGEGAPKTDETATQLPPAEPAAATTQTSTQP